MTRNIPRKRLFHQIPPCSVLPSFLSDDDLLVEDKGYRLRCPGCNTPQTVPVTCSVGRKRAEHGGFHRIHEDAGVVREGLCISPFLDFVSGM